MTTLPCPDAGMRLLHRPLDLLEIIEPQDLMESPRLGSPRPASRTPERRASGLAIDVAVRIKSAELWLNLGCPEEALRQLEALPSIAWMHPAVIRARVRALKALRRVAQ